MYNDRRYSLAQYSVNQQNKTVEITETFSESMGAVAGAAIPVDFRGRFAETLQGSARGTVSIITRFSAADILTASVRMSADVLARISLYENMLGAAYGQKNIPAAVSGAEVLSGKLYGAKNIPDRLTSEDRLTARVSGGKNIPVSVQASEVLTSMLEATSQTTERTAIQLAIPPGGELRIDSGLFLVLLNGENALYAQSGDWINISRDLLRIIVESASGGNLRGSLIYTERYL